MPVFTGVKQQIYYLISVKAWFSVLFDGFCTKAVRNGITTCKFCSYFSVTAGSNENSICTVFSHPNFIFLLSSTILKRPRLSYLFNYLPCMNNHSRLQWIPVKVEDDHEVYELWSGLKKLMLLSLNHQEQSAKIDCEDCRRTFHINREGFLLNKTILKNEYGIRIGQITHEILFKNEGFIELNDERFHYMIQNNPLAELMIYNKSKINPLLICCLEAEKEKTIVYFSKATEWNPEKFPSLLMALCWFLFLLIAKENVAAFALSA